LLPIRTEATELKLGVSRHTSRPSYTTLSHSAAHQLTHFQFSPNDEGQLYDGFKQDVVSMLQHNSVLRVFHLYGHRLPTPPQPITEVLHYFEHGSFPPLEALSLDYHIPLFIRRELELWGSRGGFAELTQLVVAEPEYLIMLLGKMPKLKHLCFFPDNRSDIDIVAAHLAALPAIESPFGPIQQPSYRDTCNRNSSAQDRRVIPWCLLHGELKWLDFYRPRFDS
jgi:hypothetical protein